MDHLTWQWQGPKSGSSSLSPGLRGASQNLVSRPWFFWVVPTWFFFPEHIARRKIRTSDLLQQLFLSLLCWLNCLCPCVKCCSLKWNQRPMSKCHRRSSISTKRNISCHPVLPVKTQRHFLPQSCLITSITLQSTLNIAINILCQLFQNAPVFSWMFRQPWNAI